MEIISRESHKDLLGYLPHIKSSLKEWKLVDIRLTGDSEKYFTIRRMADLVHSLFKEKEGKIYLCNEREIFLLIRWGLDQDPIFLSRRIEERLSAVSYEIVVHEPTSEGLQRLEMLIRYEISGTQSFNDTRYTRRENIILVGADEKYMSSLVKMGIPPKITVYQISESQAILPAYKKHAPDIVFLDSNMQGIPGAQLLDNILELDPEAYVVMLAESSLGSVHRKAYASAKGFIAKPFSPNQLMEVLRKCPTLS